MNNLIEKIRNAVIGDLRLINTSFGAKPLVYADYTASGRSLTFIEDYIMGQVLPFYGNTHTENSFTGAQTTALREQARQIVRQSVNGSEDDQIIFCGSGATAAINKLIDILNLRLPADLAERHQLEAQISAEQRPVVFIGPYEHHSNELPWRESTADLEAIPLDINGQIDTHVLEQKLQQYSDRPLRIGSFSAASNVTGIKTNVNKITALLHKYDCLSFWDYAAAAPYVSIDMNTQGERDCRKDAVFISPHKYIGGPGTPGILIVKKQILNNSVPSAPGGGTVMYVTPKDHKFISNHERREEGGTPAIVESIRAGLAIKLQQEVGTDTIVEKEEKFIRRALARWGQFDDIEVLGNSEADRLSIVSLRIKHQGKDLHYGFVVALLNDLFGIQARGGCSCAGPYGHSLLGMDLAYSKGLEAEILKGVIILRPGWVRLNFNYFIDEDTFEYLTRAIELVAEHGWRLLPYYDFDRSKGTWDYQENKMALVSSLSDFDFKTMGDTIIGEVSSKPLAEYTDIAIDEITRSNRNACRYVMILPASAEKLRWFVLPQEINAELGTIKAS